MTKATKEEKERAYLDLQSWMKKEIMTMRELLANLHQEEISLRSHDMEALQVLLQERSCLISYLGNFRSMRLIYTRRLAKLDAEPSEEIGQTCETLILRDQIIALVEKINLQNRQNHNIGQLPMALVQKVSAKKKLLLKTEGEQESE